MSFKSGRFLFSALAILLCLLGFAVQAQKKPPERAVAILYDDSGSMGNPNIANSNKRSVNANTALQTLLALLQENDDLYLLKMSDHEAGNRDMIVATISKRSMDDLISKVRAKFKPTKRRQGTYFGGMIPLLQRLQNSTAQQKWLIVVTDAEQEVQSADRLVVNNYRQTGDGIQLRFVLISPKSGAMSDKQVAGYWQKHTAASFDQVMNDRELPSVLEKLASELVGRDKKGLTFSKQKQTIAIDSELPLKGAVVLVQNSKQSLSISNAQLGSDNNPKTRLHKIQSPQNVKGINDIAYVAHITADKTINNNDKNASITFNEEIDSTAKIKVFPTVATKVKTQVFSQGQVITPQNGSYRVCEPNGVEIQTTLHDESGQLIATQKMQVSIDIDGKKTLAAKPDSNGYYRTEFTYEEIKQPLKLTVHASYPGYFDVVDAPLMVQADSCRRTIELKLLSGADNNSWSYDVSQLDSSEPLVFEVLVNGQKASKEQMQTFSLPMPDNHPWKVSTEENRFILTAKTGCCLLLWFRQGEIKATAWEITQISSSAYDTMSNPIHLSYEVVYPQNKLKYYWWRYGCPIALALFLFYLSKLFRKKRFRRKACIYYQEPGRLYTPYPLVKSSLPSLIKRIFWPSKRETRIVRNLEFIANGKKNVKVSGKNLTENFDIVGWFFDPDKQDSGAIQQDALVEDNTIIRHYRDDEIEYRMQYMSKRGNPNFDNDDDIF